MEQCGDAIGRRSRSSGQDRLAARSASPRENPVRLSVTAVTSLRKQAEVRGTQVAEKSRSPDALLPVPHTDTGRRGDCSSGGRANLCQGTRQIDPVPSEEGVPC
jgi:hypothetical protein